MGNAAQNQIRRGGDPFPDLRLEVFGGRLSTCLQCDSGCEPQHDAARHENGLAAMTKTVTITTAPRKVSAAM